jgi:hypothetical protein
LQALAVGQLGRIRSPDSAGLVLRSGRVRGSNRFDAINNSSNLLASIASKFNWVTD